MKRSSQGGGTDRGSNQDNVSPLGIDLRLRHLGDVNENGASSHVRGSEGRPRAKDACENGTVNSSSSHDFSNMDEQLAVGNETSMPGPPDGGSNPQLTANWQEPKS